MLVKKVILLKNNKERIIATYDKNLNFICFYMDLMKYIKDNVESKLNLESFIDDENNTYSTQFKNENDIINTINQYFQWLKNTFKIEYGYKIVDENPNN